VSTVVGGVLLPAAVEPPEFRELHPADRGVDVGHAVVVAELGVEVLLALAVVDDPAETRIILIRYGRHHPALPGRQVLRRVEREAGEVAERPRPLPVVLRPVGLGGVLDEDETLIVADVTDRPGVAGLAVEVDADHGLRLLCDLCEDIGRVDRGSHGVDVGKDGHRTAHRYR